MKFNLVERYNNFFSEFIGKKFMENGEIVEITDMYFEPINTSDGGSTLVCIEFKIKENKDYEQYTFKEAQDIINKIYEYEN